MAVRAKFGCAGSAMREGKTLEAFGSIVYRDGLGVRA